MLEINGWKIHVEIVDGFFDEEGSFEEILFCAQNQDKRWDEWYDRYHGCVEKVDTARPDSLENVTDEEDAALESSINSILIDIAKRISSPYLITQSEENGHEIYYYCESRKESEPMDKAIIEYFNKNEEKP